MFSSIITFILVLSILVLVHELGHFLVARKAGIWVEEFGFGIPPKIWGKKIGETTYSINLLPFGGFVRLHGENSEEGITKPRRAFLEKSKKVRTAVITAGVVMNFLLGIIAFAIVYSFSGIPLETESVKILDVNPGSPAQIAGVLVGDIVESIDGQNVTSTEGFIGLVEAKKGEKVRVVLLRGEDGDQAEITLTMTPRVDYPDTEGPLGVVITATEIYFPPIWQRPFLGVYYGVKEAVYWGKELTLGIAKLIGGLFVGRAPKEVTGPVGIFALTNEAAKVGVLALINFIGILSVNLAILNIIPFPALDGGRLLFIGLEGVVGKKVLPKVEAVVHTVGMVILILLLLAITASDVKRLIVNGGLSGFLESFVR